MSGIDLVALVVAICLIPLGGLLACVDSALGRVSVARVEEFLREERKGAKALRTIVNDRARYTNLLLLLRVTCELTATVLVTIVARAEFGAHWLVTFLTVLIMVVVSELFASNAGIGYLIFQAGAMYDTTLIFVGVIILALTGVLLNSLLRSLEQWLAPWMHSENESS